MSEPSFEEKINFLIMKSAQEARFGRWEEKGSIPVEEMVEAFEKFSELLIDGLKKMFDK